MPRSFDAIGTYWHGLAQRHIHLPRSAKGQVDKLSSCLAAGLGIISMLIQHWHFSPRPLSCFPCLLWHSGRTGRHWHTSTSSLPTTHTQCTTYFFKVSIDVYSKATKSQSSQSPPPIVKMRSSCSLRQRHFLPSDANATFSLNRLGFVSLL